MKNWQTLQPRTLALAFSLLGALSLLLLFGARRCRLFSFEGPPRVQEVALADLNGDASLDAYLTINPDGEPYLHPDYVLFNRGTGRFKDSGRTVGNTNSFSVELGDLNGDGTIDAVAGNQVYLNYGSELFDRGAFPVGSRTMGTFRWHVALADLDGDGNLDLFSAACCGGAVESPGRRPLYSEDQVWLNKGDGRFSSTGQALAPTGSNAVALGDLNGDGSHDAFVASGLSTLADGSTVSATPNTVWFNDGRGRFRQSSVLLGERESLAVALGDIEGDGDLDAVVGNKGPDAVWLNDGRGRFRLGEQDLEDGETRFIFLRDLNEDGHLDLFLGERTGGWIWLNDSTGRWQRSRQRIDYDDDAALALGDVTGDGLIDVFVADVDSYRVWRGEGNGRFSAGPRTQHH